jgi:hypothetical protein
MAAMPPRTMIPVASFSRFASFRFLRGVRTLAPIIAAALLMGGSAACSDCTESGEECSSHSDCCSEACLDVNYGAYRICE